MAENVELFLCNDLGQVQSLLLRANQCKFTTIKDLFGLDQNVRFYLKNRVTQQCETCNDNGHFDITSGKYDIIIQNAQTERRSVQIRDHGYGLHQPPMFVPGFQRPNVSFHSGVRSPRLQIGRQLVPSPQFIPHHAALEEPSATVYFRLGKWTSSGEIVVKRKNIVNDVPVKLTARDLVSVKTINEAVTAAIKNNEELNDPKVSSYFVYRSTRAALMDSDQIKSVEFWTKQQKPGQFFAMVSRPPIGNESSDDSDEEYVGEACKRKASGKKAKGFVKKLATSVREDIMSLQKNIISDEATKNLLRLLQDSFLCSICRDIIKGRPAVCTKCCHIVGCESCNKQLKEREERDEYSVIKEAGIWICPLCRYRQYQFDTDLGFHMITGCEFLVHLATLNRVEKEGN